MGNQVQPTRSRAATTYPPTTAQRGISRTNAEIATELFLGVATVKAYASSLFDKLGVRDRVHATVLAYESGFVHPGVEPRAEVTG